MRQSPLGPLLVFAPLCVAPVLAQASTLTVCAQGCAYASINDAVTAAKSGDTVSVGSGTYHELVSITQKNLNLIGNSEDTTVLDGVSYAGGLYVQGVRTSPGTVVNISKLTVTHAAGGGIVVSQAEVHLDKVILISNESEFGNGGGLAVLGGTVTVTHSVIAHNHAPNGGGGGLYVGEDFSDSRPGILTVTDSVVSANSAYEGGGLFVGANGTANLVSSTVSENNAQSGGGAFIAGAANAFPAGAVALNGVTLNNNVASVNGGGLYLSSLSVTLKNSYFLSNAATGSGGGVFSRHLHADFFNPTLIFAANTPDNCNEEICK
jgi:hypothetical protein